MLQTPEAVLNERGQLQFLEPLKFTQAQRVLVTLLREPLKIPFQWFDTVAEEIGLGGTLVKFDELGRT